MSKAIIKPQAEIDLIDIWQFIADNSIERADSFLDRINNTVQNLAGMPNMGRSREEIARHLHLCRHPGAGNCNRVAVVTQSEVATRKDSVYLDDFDFPAQFFGTGINRVSLYHSP